MAGSFNKLRKKPKHVRDNIAFGVAGGFTLMLAVAWFFVGFNGVSKDPSVAGEEANGAFSTLLNQIQEQVATAKEGVASDAETASPAVGGDWGLSAQNASTSDSSQPKEAAIMIVTSSSSVNMSSTTASTSMLY